MMPLSSWSPVLAREYLDADDAAALAAFHAQRGVFHVACALSPKIERKRRSSGVSWVSPFGRYFADQDVAGAHFRADADDAVFVEIAEFAFRNVRDVVRRHFGAELGVAHDADELFDVDRGELRVLRPCARR